MAAGFSRRVLSRTVAAKLLAEPKRRAHWVQALASYLVEHKRVHEADKVLNDIAHELHKQGGHLFVDVTSSHGLQAAVRAALTKALTEQTGARQVEIAEHTDPHLLGGVVARTPDAILDASVRRKLQQLAAIK